VSVDSLAQAYKTPLTVILAASAGLSELGQLTGPQADLVALIDEQASLLSEMTSRLLAAARLDTNEVDVSLKAVGVEPMIDDAIAGLKRRLSGSTVVIDLKDDNLVLLCDRQLMLLLLAQYLDNACTHSVPGATITLRAAQLDSSIVFSAHSFGPAIPAADWEYVFEPDYPFSSHGYHAARPGIGLSLARRIATIHGGTVWVDSKESEGTTFFAAIPSHAKEIAPDE
jgi:two-component system sensor histidine kinase KdpD